MVSTGAKIAIALAVLATAGVAAYFVLGTKAAGGLKVTVQNPTLHYGDILYWSATGLTPNSTEDNQVVANDGTTWDLGTLPTGPQGVVSASFVVATNIASGTNQFKVIDLATGKSGTVNFTVS